MVSRIVKVLCLAVTVAVLATALAACAELKSLIDALTPATKTVYAPPSEPPSSPPEPEQETETEPEPDPWTLVVGCAQLPVSLNPFYADTAQGEDVLEMTQILLVDSDRAGNIVLRGIDGETAGHNGVDYTYYGVADVTIDQMADGTVDYNIKLREDLVFSDGAPVTIDDLIFSMYVYCDPDYDGGCALYDMPITGMGRYRTGLEPGIYEKYAQMADSIHASGPDNKDFKNWTKEQQELFWDTLLIPLASQFAQGIVDIFADYYGEDAAEALGGSEVALGMKGWGYGDVTEDGFITHYTRSTYTLEGDDVPAIEDFLYEMLTAYQWDVETMSAVEYVGMDLYGELVSAFISIEGRMDPDFDGEISAIDGIKKTGGHSMTVTADFFEESDIYLLKIPIAPLHYYGDWGMYDYSRDMYGFTKGDLSALRENASAPMGAGPYKFLSYEDGIISFEANESYYKGEPKIKYVHIKESPGGDILAGVVSGSFDIADLGYSEELLEELREYNESGELTGWTIMTGISDNLSNPNRQRPSITIVSRERVNTATVTPGITASWGWKKEIELLEMK